MRNLVNVLLVNFKLLPMAKSDSTLFGIPARYSPFSIVNIRYNILSCVTYKGVCSFCADYIGETIRDV